MRWPQELRQLDEDLAAGRLSPEQYIRRRDELLRDRGGAAPEPGSADHSPAGSSPRSPFPPPFRWETTPRNETTDVIPPVPAVEPDTGGDSDTTQVVPARTEPQPEPQPQPQPRSESQSEPESENTQVVHQITHGPHRPESKQEIPGFSTPVADSSTPPWTLPEEQQAWVSQSTGKFELFSRTKNTLGIVVLAVLVLGLMSAALGYVLSDDSVGQASDNGQHTPPAAPLEPMATQELPAPPEPSPAPENTRQALIEPPGQIRSGGGRFDMRRVENDSLVPPSIIAALGSADMTDGVLKTTTRGSTTIAMFAFTVRDEQAASAVVDAIIAEQRDGGLEDDYSRALQGVTVLGSTEGSAETVYRAAYVLYDRVIFVEAFGPNRTAVLVVIDALLAQQVDHAPPTVR